MIQRYEVCQWKHHTIQEDNGNYCLYKDVKKLEQELADVKEANRWRHFSEDIRPNTYEVVIQSIDGDFIHAVYVKEIDKFYSGGAPVDIDGCIGYHMLGEWGVKEIKESGVGK